MNRERGRGLTADSTIYFAADVNADLCTWTDADSQFQDPHISDRQLNNARIQSVFRVYAEYLASAAAGSP